MSDLQTYVTMLKAALGLATATPGSAGHERITKMVDLRVSTSRSFTFVRHHLPRHSAAQAQEHLVSVQAQK